MKVIGKFTLYSTYYTRISKKICKELDIVPGDEVLILEDDGTYFMRKNGD